MSAVTDFLFGRKPRKPAAILAESAGNAEDSYRDFLRIFRNQIMPSMQQYAGDYSDLVSATDNYFSNAIQEYESQHPYDEEFAQEGRELERQSLRELGEMGSIARQDELGLEARERARGFLDANRRAAESESFGYGRSSPANIGLTAAQEAAALAVAENDARRAERYRGEGARLNMLPTIRGVYSEGEGNRAMQLASLGDMRATNALRGAEGVSGIHGLTGDYYDGVVTPAMDTAIKTRGVSDRAWDAYGRAKSQRIGRAIRNIGAVVAAPFTGGASLSTLQLGGEADGSGSFSPMDMGIGPGMFSGGGGSNIGSGKNIAFAGNTYHPHTLRANSGANTWRPSQGRIGYSRGGSRRLGSVM